MTVGDRGLWDFEGSEKRPKAKKGTEKVVKRRERMKRDTAYGQKYVDTPDLGLFFIGSLVPILMLQHTMIFLDNSVLPTWWQQFGPLPVST